MYQKLLVSLFIFLLVAGCATAQKMDRLSIGMTQDQVVAAMGRPASTAADGGIVFLLYRLSETDIEAYRGIEGRYYVRLRDGRVDSWGRVGDFDTTKDPTSKKIIDLTIKKGN